MSGAWKDTPTAAAMRDVIVKICEQVVNRMMPPPAYASVVSIDEGTRTAMVNYSGEEGNPPVPVRILSLIPASTGQLVRIGGRSGDRYIEAVVGSTTFLFGMDRIGDATVWGGATPPPGSMACNGAALSVSDYPALFSVLGYRHGGAGASFNLPTYVAPGPNGIWIIRVK